MTNATPTKVVKAGQEVNPALFASEEDMARLIDEAFENFLGCKWEETKQPLKTTLDILDSGKAAEEAFQGGAVEMEKKAAKMIHDAEKTRSADDKYYKLMAAKTLTIEELISLVNYLGAEREQSDYIDRLLFSKRLVHKKRGYGILAFRGVGGKAFVKLEGYAHVQFMEKEENQGWIPLDHQTLQRVLGEETSKAVQKLEEHLPESPQDIIELISLLKDRKTDPLLIKQKIMQTRPTIKVGGHGAVVDYYAEKDGASLIHLQGFPQKVLVRVEKEHIEKAVTIAHLLKSLDEKLARIAPFKISSLGAAVTADSKDILQIPAFSNEFSPEDVSALLFLNEKRGIVII
jgi:hypothetical protein